MGGFNIINIGGSELVFILIIAGIFLGPHRIRNVAKWIGRLTVQARNISRQFTQQLEAELDETEREELRGALSDLKLLRSEVADLKSEILRGPQALLDESDTTVKALQKEVDDLQKEVDRSVQADSVQVDPEPENQIGGTSLPNLVDVEGDPAV